MRLPILLALLGLSTVSLVPASACGIPDIAATTEAQAVASFPEPVTGFQPTVSSPDPDLTAGPLQPFDATTSRQVEATESTPEPDLTVLLACGLALILLGRWRLSR